MGPDAHNFMGTGALWPQSFVEKQGARVDVGTLGEYQHG